MALLATSTPASVPSARRSRRIAAVVALLFALSSVASYALPRPAAAWDKGTFNSTSEKDLVGLTNRVARRPASGRSRSTRRSPRSPAGAART